MEPEEHIFTFGVDHYIETVFPDDRLSERIKRRKHLLSYKGLKLMQDHYEKYKFKPLG